MATIEFQLSLITDPVHASVEKTCSLRRFNFSPTYQGINKISRITGKLFTFAANKFYQIFTTYYCAFEKRPAAGNTPAIQFLWRVIIRCCYHICFVPGYGATGSECLERSFLDDTIICLRKCSGQKLPGRKQGTDAILLFHRRWQAIYYCQAYF